MTCRFTFELCRSWKSNCINSQGDGNLVLSLSYLTQLRIQKLKFLWSWHPGVFSWRKRIMKIFCIPNSIYCSFTTCVPLSWAFGWMKALLQQEPDMNPFWNVSCSSPLGPAAFLHASLCQLCFTESCDGRGPFILPQLSATLWEMTGLRCSFIMIYLSR